MFPFDFIGDILGGVGDIALSVVNPVTNALGLGNVQDFLGSYKNQMTGEHALQMNRENIAMQRETNQQNWLIHQGDMQLAKDLQTQAQNFNAAEAEKTRQFNSAPEQMARLQQAGINPFAAAQAVSGVQGNNSGATASVSANSAPIGAPMVSPRNDISTAQLPLQNMLALFGMGSDLIRALGSSKKDRAEAKQITTLLGENLELLKNTNKESYIKQVAGKINNQILKETGLATANQRLKNMVAEYSEIIARTDYTSLQGDVAEAQTGLIELQQHGQALANKLTRKQLAWFDPMQDATLRELNTRIRNIDADTGKKKAETLDINLTRDARIKNLNASTYNLISSGKLNDEQAQTIREQRPLVLEWQKLLNEGKVTENNWLGRRLANEVELQVKELQRCGLINQQEQERLEILHKENNLKYVKEVVGMISDIGDTASKFMPYRFPFQSSTTGEFKTQNIPFDDRPHNKIGF